MSFGKIEESDLRCPNACSLMFPEPHRACFTCPACGWSVTALEVFTSIEDDLGEMVATRVIGSGPRRDEGEVS